MRNRESVDLTTRAGTVVMSAGTSKVQKSRIGGFDFARSLALGGMLLINFKAAMVSSIAEPHWLAEWIAQLEGRAAAIFVVLAGAGISLMLKKSLAAQDLKTIARQRKSLLKRASFLLVVGLGFMTIWPADILHFYAMFISIGVLLSNKSDWILFGTAGLFLLGAPVLNHFLDSATELDFNSTGRLTVFWAIRKLWCDLLFTGYYPLFPWACF